MIFPRLKIDFVIPFVMLCAMLLLLSGCNKSNKETDPLLDPALLSETLRAYQDYALSQNALAIVASQQLQLHLMSFLKVPEEAQSQTLKSSWLVAHKAYLASQYGSFVRGEDREALIYSIESWPIQPGFIDALPDYPTSGIINDITLPIDLTTLREQHGITDREEVSLGFHALEYLIFGRDLTDFRDEEFNQRRRRFLQLVTEELLLNLQQSVLMIENQFAEREDYSDLHRIYDLLRSTSGYLQTAQRESNLLIDENIGHSIYSQSSISTLAIELSALEAFYLKEVNLMPLLSEIEMTTAANFKKTLLDANALFTDPEAGEADFAKLPLMISALSHQLENFELILGRQNPQVVDEVNKRDSLLK